jgi:hypothetical protein
MTRPSNSGDSPEINIGKWTLLKAMLTMYLVLSSTQEWRYLSLTLKIKLLDSGTSIEEYKSLRQEKIQTDFGFFQLTLLSTISLQATTMV